MRVRRLGRSSLRRSGSPGAAGRRSRPTMLARLRARAAGQLSGGGRGLSRGAGVASRRDVVRAARARAGAAAAQPQRGDPARGPRRAGERTRRARRVYGVALRAWARGRPARQHARGGRAVGRGRARATRRRTGSGARPRSAGATAGARPAGVLGWAASGWAARRAGGGDGAARHHRMATTRTARCASGSRRSAGFRDTASPRWRRWARPRPPSVRTILRISPAEADFTARRLEAELRVNWGDPLGGLGGAGGGAAADRAPGHRGAARAARPAPDAAHARRHAGAGPRAGGDRRASARPSQAARLRLEAAQAYSAAGDREAARRMLAGLADDRSAPGHGLRRGGDRAVQRADRRGQAGARPAGGWPSCGPR